MPGSFTIRPVEASLTHNTELIGKMSPYCKFVYGDTYVNTQVCKKGGEHPTWEDSVTISSDKIKDSKLTIELMDKNLLKDDFIGECPIDLKLLQANIKDSKWYPIFYKSKQAGEILLETIYEPEIVPVLESVEKVVEAPVASHVFTEQHQVVEPHTFLKNVEVTETIAVQKEIEVMEPRKVLKEVEYTEAVPVTKTIEVVEPEVVMKEVEVIEPRVVTKTIQVIENVPVKKQVEVVEMVHKTKEVETLEPQTFTKQVEVIEQVPVMKTVTVSEPVTVQKAVEFVEPVITTQTITKEIIEPVVVKEEVITEVGPATIMENVVVEKKIEKIL